MKKYLVLFKDKNSTTISMVSGLTLGKAYRVADRARKDGASSIQIRVRTIGSSSVLVA